jgi:hypothetical protein
VSASSTVVAQKAEAEPPRLSPEARAFVLAAVYYLLGALFVTLWLWRDPASRTVAGNPNDADQFTWFLRYDATAIVHGKLPALVTTAMNAPQGISVMWNTFILLPGVLLTPVTLLLGPQTSLTILMTLGFAGSATSMFYLLRRWDASVTAAVIGGAVYGFSPALLQASIGHYDFQFAVLPPLIIDAALRLVAGRVHPGRAGVVRGGLRLGLLLTAQLLTSEELLLDTAFAGILLVIVLAAGRPHEILQRARAAVAAFGIAAAVTLLVCGYPLWAQFFGPLHQHGSAFEIDFYKNDLAGFVTPSSLLIFHTASSANFAAKTYQGGMPEYLAYLGFPLLIALVVAAIKFWHHPAIRAAAVTFAVLEICSLGGTLLVGGHEYKSVLLPWHLMQSVPVINAALPTRLSILADGAAAVVVALSYDAARRLPRVASARLGSRFVTVGVILVLLPIIPRPLPAAVASSVPVGWSATFRQLNLPAGARVLVIPVPVPTFTEPLRWQADTGQPASLIGGYFTGPAWNGQAYIEGNGLAPEVAYLNQLWAAPSWAVEQSEVQASPTSTRTPAQVRAQLAKWHPAAIVVVTSMRSPLGEYLISLFGKPQAGSGRVLAWRAGQYSK